MLQSRISRLAGVMLAGFVALSIWSYLQLKQNRGASAAAAASLQECRELAGQIHDLRAQPLRAGLWAHSRTELAERIEESANNAQVPFAHVMRIDPLGARRIDNTAYLQQATSVQLESITLKQLVTLVSSLTESDGGLQVPAIRLLVSKNAPRASTGAEIWDAEVTLTYLIFSPTSE